MPTIARFTRSLAPSTRPEGYQNAALTVAMPAPLRTLRLLVLLPAVVIVALPCGADGGGRLIPAARGVNIGLRKNDRSRATLHAFSPRDRVISLFEHGPQHGAHDGAFALAQLDLRVERVVARLADLDAVKPGAQRARCAPVDGATEQHVVDPERRLGHVALDLERARGRRTRGGASDHQPEQRRAASHPADQ